MIAPITIRYRSRHFNSGIKQIAKRIGAITDHNAEIIIGMILAEDIKDGAPDFTSLNPMIVAPKVDEQFVLIVGTTLASQQIEKATKIINIKALIPYQKVLDLRKIPVQQELGDNDEGNFST